MDIILKIKKIKDYKQKELKKFKITFLSSQIEIIKKNISIQKFFQLADKIKHRN